MRVVVVGAGIAGLSAAHSLLGRARIAGCTAEVMVVEGAARPGGHVWSIRNDGFVVEAGPNGFRDGEPTTLALMDDLKLTPSLACVSAGARRRFVLAGGRLRRVPDSPAALLTSDVLSRGGKLRLLLEPWARRAPAGTTEESVDDFARRRLGREAAETLVDAAVSGLTAGDSRTLSMAAAFPRVAEMERQYGSLVRAMIARRAGRPRRLLSLAGGMGTLVDVLAARLGAALRVGSPVTRVGRRGGEWRVGLASGEEVVADRVVLAVPARAAGPVVESLDPALARGLAGIPAAGVVAVALAYQASDLGRPLDGYGYVVRRGERLSTLGVVWESALFPGRAPEGFVLLRAILGGARDPEAVRLPETELVERAHREVSRAMGVMAAARRAWVFRWPGAIAQYTRGHLERVARVRAAAAGHPGLELCGTSFDGISFNAAVASGADVARRVIP